MSHLFERDDELVSRRRRMEECGADKTMWTLFPQRVHSVMGNDENCVSSGSHFARIAPLSSLILVSINNQRAS